VKLYLKNQTKKKLKIKGRALVAKGEETNSLLEFIEGAQFY
jgi:hypothetical protein